jgi:glycerol-3-phosphate dehydrogenase (NAD(P)+)
VDDLARKHGIEMPVCQAVANIVNAGADVDNEIHKLLSRPLKAERD